jgi:hypothetical protein
VAHLGADRQAGLNVSTSRAWRGFSLTRLKSRLNAEERSIVRIKVGHQVFQAVEPLAPPFVQIQSYSRKNDRRLANFTFSRGWVKTAVYGLTAFRFAPCGLHF